MYFFLLLLLLLLLLLTFYRYHDGDDDTVRVALYACDEPVCYILGSAVDLHLNNNNMYSIGIFTVTNN